MALNPFGFTSFWRDPFQDIFEPDVFNIPLTGTPSRGQQQLISGRQGQQGALATFRPSIDVSETDKELVVHAELPGLSKEDVKVDLRGNHLELSGEKESKSEQEDEGKTWRRVERQWGSFNRRIPLPPNVDPKKVRATFKNGVLEIKVEKPQQQDGGQKGSTIMVE